MNDNRRLPIDVIQAFQLDQEELNRQLEVSVREQIAHEKPLGQGVTHSNIKGWQSERDLQNKLNEDTPLSKQLLKLFASFAGPMVEYVNACCVRCNIKESPNYDWDYSGAWFNVALNGSYNAPHTHPLSQISGAYYVRTEEPPADHPFSGRIDFFDETGERHFFPRPGTLLLFPSTTLHFVHPYYGKEHRICLSFNVNNLRDAKK